MTLADAGTVAGAASGAARPVRFIGPEKDYWRIVVRGAVLLMVTLGLYRFWLATDIRRFLWANTEIDGESLEYSGTALELLQGFLFAIALILPIYIAFTITVLDLGAFGNFLSTSAVLLLAFLSQYGIYLARRYRLTRTVYRGLRFHQTGSAIRYSICAVWWWGWTALTLGFAYPFTRAALERYKMRNTFYGDLQGRFEGSGWHLFIRGFLMWLAVLIPLLATAVALLSIKWSAVDGVLARRRRRDRPHRKGQSRLSRTIRVCDRGLRRHTRPGRTACCRPSTPWSCAGGSAASGSVRSSRSRICAPATSISPICVSSVISPPSIVVLLVGVFFGLVFLGAFAEDGSILSEFLTVAMMVGTYVVFMLGLITLYNAVVTLSVWRLTANSIALSDTAPIGRVKAPGDASSPLGEGIADVLNLGGI